jgi:nitrate reductase NapD
MNLSGILVITAPEKVPTVCQALGALDGVEVFHTDAPTGRIVIVQEADSVNDEIASLKQIKRLPHIIMAEMVHHYVGDSTEHAPFEDIPADLDSMTGLADAVPAYLNS